MKKSLKRSFLTKTPQQYLIFPDTPTAPLCLCAQLVWVFPAPITGTPCVLCSPTLTPDPHQDFSLSFLHSSHISSLLMFYSAFLTLSQPFPSLLQPGSSLDFPSLLLPVVSEPSLEKAQALSRTQPMRRGQRHRVFISRRGRDQT